MHGHIYKATPSITKDEILSTCTFDDMPDYGDVMTYESFVDAISSYCIMDYDGCGELILNNKVVDGTCVWIGNRTMYFEDRFFVPLDTLHELFGDDMKFIWFNK